MTREDQPADRPLYHGAQQFSNVTDRRRPGLDLPSFGVQRGTLVLEVSQGRGFTLTLACEHRASLALASRAKSAALVRPHPPEVPVRRFAARRPCFRGRTWPRAGQGGNFDGNELWAERYQSRGLRGVRVVAGSFVSYARERACLEGIFRAHARGGGRRTTRDYPHPPQTVPRHWSQQRAVVASRRGPIPRECQPSAASNRAGILVPPAWGRSCRCAVRNCLW